MRWTILLFILLSCTQSNSTVGSTSDQAHTDDPVYTQPSLETTGPPDFDGIANALGCVFAPQTCNKE